MKKKNGSLARRPTITSLDSKASKLAAKRIKQTKALTKIRDWKPRFIQALSVLGSVHKACIECEITKDLAYDHKRKDAKFRAAWEKALDISVDTLEEEMRRRAQFGVDEPIYYKDQKIDTVKKYSDTLAIFLAKAHRPEKYRERYEASFDPSKPLRVEIVYVNDWRKGSDVIDVTPKTEDDDE